MMKELVFLQTTNKSLMRLIVPKILCFVQFEFDKIEFFTDEIQYSVFNFMKDIQERKISFEDKISLFLMFELI